LGGSGNLNKKEEGEKRKGGRKGKSRVAYSGKRKRVRPGKKKAEKNCGGGLW